MHSASDENKLKTCLTRMIDAISQSIQKLKEHKGRSSATTTTTTDKAPSHTSGDDLNSGRDSVNPRANIFTLDKVENDLLAQLTDDIESFIEDCLPLLTNTCATSFSDYLHQYHYDSEERKFACPLTKNALPILRHELQGLLASRAAFSAAAAGDQPTVKKFVEDYPTLKERPSFSGATLLYTVALNNQLDTVKYLVDKARCDVNTRNWRTINNDLTPSAAETRNPVLGSTALHAACTNNHLRVVEYLVVDKNADYFAKNQANKTPIDYGERHKDIKQFFQDFLLVGYLTTSSVDGLPKKPIIVDDELQLDCIWEYKPWLEVEWQAFSNEESQILHQALSSTKNVHDPIELKTPQGLFHVSLATFVRTNASDPKNPAKQAWIRCRGSSVLNFHIEGFWQLMFMRYPTAGFEADSSVELNKWYTCDPKTNSLLNDAMNQRRKVAAIVIEMGTIEEPMKCDLQTFTLVNENKSMLGYLRWIPKLISKDERIKGKVHDIDNFKMKSGVEVLPLTTEKRVERVDSNIELEQGPDHSHHHHHPHDYEGDDDDDDDYDYVDARTKAKKKAAGAEKSWWSPREINKGESTTNTIPPPKDVQPHDKEHKGREGDDPDDTRLHNEGHKRDDPDPKQDDAERPSRETSPEDDATSPNDLDKRITTRTNYRTKPSEAMQTYLIGQGELVVEHLNKKQRLPDYYVDKIPKLYFHEDKSSYVASLTGLPTHHREFEHILESISHLFSDTERIKDKCKRAVTETADAVIQILTKRIRSTSEHWKHYTEYFLQIIEQHKQKYADRFDENITDKSKLLASRAITDSKFQARAELEKEMEQYEKSHSFTHELELIKQAALNEFIEQQIYEPRKQFERKPSKESLQVMNDFIEEKKKEMKTDKRYKGLEVAPFKSISKLLQALTIYNHCFQLQLPLFESAPELFGKIHDNTVVTISTSTGSGKSTLLPALLIAEGYDRVLVTQPRRLPCTAICERVNNTMTSENDKEPIAGWAVSGAEHDTHAPILYLTDGLLREQLLHDEDLITEQTDVDKSVVFFLDEVHERSINIDLCLALLARLLTTKPQLKSKMKLVISSATLDTSVPNLFRQIGQLKFAEFQMPKLGTLYPVTKHRRPTDNVLALVQELNKKRQRNDQILCFVSSVADVNLGCRLLQELSSGSIVAYPLVQAQPAAEQQKLIEQGSIFFSTTVAETSLTFPNLRYVIDTGMINLPVYDFESQQTVLRQVRAAESTIKQRLGRLGRTQPGDYYALYDYKVEEKKFPTPQICQSELSNIELTLRKSPSQEGLNQMKKFLPDEPSQEAISAALARLRKFDVITPPPNERFTKEGTGISKLPDFGSVEMSKAVHAALTRYRCGHDMIVISSVLGVLNTSTVLTSIPKQFRSPDGDFMSILNVMNAMLDEKKSTPAQHFKLKQFCEKNGLQGAYSTLKQASRRYETLAKAFIFSKDFRTQSQVRSGQWELIAKALLKGYSDNVFVSLKELQGRTHRFTRYESSKSYIDVAVLDKQSTLNRTIGSAPVSLVVARDIRYATSIRAKAVLSFVGEIKPTWIEYEVERVVTLNEDEKKRLENEKVLSSVAQKFADVEVQLKRDHLSISGPSGSVLNAELFILQKLVEEMKFSSSSDLPANSEEYRTLQRNMEGIVKMIRVFNPMKWRWENEEQVQITLEEGPGARLDVTIRGRNSKNRLVQKEFLNSFHWLRHCAVIRTPNSDVPPRLLIPQVRHKYLDVEERISHVTDSKRTTIDLWNALQGPDATRETRMEAVAWIAICRFGCKLEGGFVRDWIVGNYTARPQGTNADPSTWVIYVTNAEKQKMPTMHNEVVPADLDCHLPIFNYFDIDKFLDFMHKYQIECKVFREQWRYVLLFDEQTKTGPFTMDLIEPHVALTHDRLDFDVSNLVVEMNYTKELGMRVNTEQPPYSIDIETIVERIRQKKLQILRPSDDILQRRIKKMVDVRGWTVINPSLYVIPRPPGKHRVVIVSLPADSDLYKDMVKEMQAIANAQVLKIEQLRNPGLEELYLGMKKLIQSQCKDRNANERCLFHGTKGKAIDGIRDYGYDDRFTGANTAKGDWGHGTYFAANTQYDAHWHTEPDEQDHTRVIYYNRVLLGNAFVMQKLDQELKSAPLDHHSVHGIHPEEPDRDEFIVYRYGQALPYLKITYKT